VLDLLPEDPELVVELPLQLRAVRRRALKVVKADGEREDLPSEAHIDAIVVEAFAEKLRLLRLPASSKSSSMSVIGSMGGSDSTNRSRRRITRARVARAAVERGKSGSRGRVSLASRWIKSCSKN
jgi:hypothetical protein